jgi:hypothetical protein
MFANVQEYYHATPVRDALKKLGKNDQQVPVPVIGAFELIGGRRHKMPGGHGRL